MENAWKTYVSLGLCFLLTAFVLSSSWAKEGTIQADKKIKAHKVVRLHYISGINPKEVTIQPGTTVIWINDSRSLAEIQFTDKEVTLACKSPTHFVLDQEGAFVSNKIPEGTVASLCFVQKGEYEYIVIRDPRRHDALKSMPEPLLGKIIVK